MKTYSYEKIKRILCDKCGKEIGFWDIYSSEKFVNAKIEIDGKIKSCDLCKDCTIEVLGDYFVEQ